MPANEEDIIELNGVVREILPDFTFKVELENGAMMLAKGSGRLRKKRIRISIMDKVVVEISKYGLNFGRIAKRLDDKRENYSGQRRPGPKKRPPG